QRNDDRAPVTPVKSRLYVTAITTDSYKQHTDNRSDKPYARNKHRQQDGRNPTETILRDNFPTQYHRSQDRGYVRAKKVGPHTGYVTYVIAYVSAMVAGLRGSSSGIPASTFPTRSAPTSAALVKIPPPTRAKRACVDAPIPKVSI